MSNAVLAENLPGMYYNAGIRVCRFSVSAEVHWFSVSRGNGERE